MNCKNCNQEIPENEKLCPHCGAEAENELPEEVIAPELVEEPVQEQAEELVQEQAEESVRESEEEQTQEAKPKTGIWKWIALAVGGIVLLGVLALAILYGLGIDLKPKANDITVKTSYSVDDETAIAKKDKVVATMGDKELTNGELQLYYQNLLYTFSYEYAYYMSYLGLDMTQPLDAQACAMEEGKTWEQYFLEGAIENWQSYTLVELMAENEQFVISEELQASLDGIEADVRDYASSEGYDSVDDYIHDGIGVNVSLDNYRHFNEVYYVSNEYLDSVYENAYPTAEEIEAYYNSNEATFTSNGITKDMGLLSNVRHILVSVEGGTEDEEGNVTYTDEDWNNALTEAERILQEWKDGAATEESFTELANTYSDDPGVITNSGLYEDISIDASYLANFREWAIDSARVPGETGIVQTDAGYHIMYFVSGEDYCSFLVAEEVIADVIRGKLLQAKAEYPIEINYKNIYLAQSELSA